MKVNGYVTVTLIVLSPVLALGALWFAVGQEMLPATKNGTFAATAALSEEPIGQAAVAP
jgi:hypothetical protein